MISPIHLRRLAALAVLILVVAACGNGQGAVSTTSTIETSLTSSTLVTSTTFPEVTTPPEATTTTEQAAGQTVLVVFASSGQSECSDTETYNRAMEEAAEPIESAFRLLVAGPTPEEQASGADSFFSTETEGMVESVTVDNGLLIIDFDDLRSVIPNASTSCGHMSLIAQLNGTAFQFDEVDRVTYSIEGSCDTFFNWLQTDCQTYARP